MKTLRIMSIMEGSSLLLLLFIAVPLKRLLEIPEAVSVIGPIHGVLFILFNLILLTLVIKSQLKFTHAIIGFIASLIPFGTFVFKAKLLSKYPQNS